MIDLPDKYCSNLFDENLKRGSVVRTRFCGNDGKEKFHRFVVLNNNILQDTLFCVTTTSKLDFYNKHPNYNRDIIRLPAGHLSFFPKETIIDCRSIYTFQKNNLKKNFQTAVLDFAGILPAELLKQIDEIVTQSYFIAKRDKVMVIGNKI